LITAAAAAVEDEESKRPKSIWAAATRQNLPSSNSNGNSNDGQNT